VITRSALVLALCSRRTGSREPADATDRPAAQEADRVLRQLPLPANGLDQGAPGGGQGRLAPGRAVPADRLHRDHPDPTQQACGLVLQQPRQRRTAHQRRQGCDPLDAAVLPRLSPQHPTATAPYARLHPCQLPAQLGPAQRTRTRCVSLKSDSAQPRGYGSCRPCLPRWISAWLTFKSRHLGNPG
jgi:hypothetical protein